MFLNSKFGGMLSANKVAEAAELAKIESLLDHRIRALACTIFKVDKIYAWRPDGRSRHGRSGQDMG